MYYYSLCHNANTIQYLMKLILAGPTLYLREYEYALAFNNAYLGLELMEQRLSKLFANMDINRKNVFL